MSKRSRSIAWELRGAAGKTRCWSLLAATLALASGCGPPAGVDAPQPRGNVSTQAKSYDTYTVVARAYREAVDLPGASVHGMETTPIFAKVGGFVIKVSELDGEQVDIGSSVSAGDVLAELGVPELWDELGEKKARIDEALSAVRQAEASVKKAEAEHEQRKTGVVQANAMKEEAVAAIEAHKTEVGRYEELVRSKAARADLLDQARAELKAAEAMLKTADAGISAATAAVVAAVSHIGQTKADKDFAEAKVRVAEAAAKRVQTLIEYAQIKAPYDGVVTKRHVDHGAFVQPATSNSGASPLFEITRRDRVRIVASAPMNKAALIKRGQPIRFHSIGGLPGVEVDGKVTRTTVALDERSRMLRIDVHLTNPVTPIGGGEPVKLNPGMFGALSLTIKDWEKLAVVPTTAVGSDGDSFYVMVVKEGRCERRAVDVVFNDAIEVGVGSGLSEGEVIVAKEITQLEDGQKIE